MSNNPPLLQKLVYMTSQMAEIYSGLSLGRVSPCREYIRYYIIIDHLHPPSTH